MTLALTLPVVSLLIKIIQIGGDYFFVYAWLFITIMSLVISFAYKKTKRNTIVLSFSLIQGIAFIYPNYIAPLFDRYDPLREGELRSSIEALAAKINFPLAKIFVVEGKLFPNNRVIKYI